MIVVDILTCPPPKTKEPSLLRSFKGIHAASNELNAGKVVPKLDRISKLRKICLTK